MYDEGTEGYRDCDDEADDWDEYKKTLPGGIALASLVSARWLDDPELPNTPTMCMHRVLWF